MSSLSKLASGIGKRLVSSQRGGKLLTPAATKLIVPSGSAGFVTAPAAGTFAGIRGGRGNSAITIAATSTSKK